MSSNINKSASVDNTKSFAKKKPRSSPLKLVDQRLNRYLDHSVVLEEGNNPQIIQTIMFCISIGIVAFIIWASVTYIDEVAITTGEVIPSDYVRIVQHLEGGIVKEIHVKEGDLVEKDQILYQLDKTAVLSDLEQYKQRWLYLTLQTERLRAFTEQREGNFQARLSSFTDIVSTISPDKISNMISDQQNLLASMHKSRENEKSILSRQTKQAKEEINRLKSRHDMLKKNIILLAEERDIRHQLETKGWGSKVVLLETERAFNAIQGENNQVISELGKANQAHQESKERLASLDIGLREQALRELNELEAQLSETYEILLKLSDRYERATIRSPVRGIVKGLEVNTIGGVAPPGMKLAEIVPIEEKLVVEVRVAPRDIGHISLEQPVKVKVQAFDFARYGAVEGSLANISATTYLSEKGEPYYKARINLKQEFIGPEIRNHRLIPGMTVQADIITGNKTVLAYLLKPIYVTAAHAFHEK